MAVYVFDPDRVKVSDFPEESYIKESFSFNINAIEAGEGFIRVNVKGNLNYANSRIFKKRYQRSINDES